MATHPDYSSLRKELLNGAISCVEQVKHHLELIEKNKHLNCFLSVYSEESLNAAKAIDAKIKLGSAGKLAGLVVGLKDVLAFKNHPLQAASNILNGFHSQYSATVVERLLAEDAIIIGRQNCDEFGMGSTNENSAFGESRNPHNPQHTPGGSSGGSAAAVAAGLCHVSLGSDTGGSVRQPASFCGIYGLKPTYSRISRHGLIAYASSFDTIGVLANSTDDCAKVLQVIAGKDDFDSTASSLPVPDYSGVLKNSSNKKFRIGVVANIPSESLQPEIRESITFASEHLESSGHKVTQIDLPLNEFILPTYYVLTTAEASSNLSRYDGVRYGHRSTSAEDLESLYRNTRTEGFGEEVKRRILLGNFVLSSDHFDAYYAQAQKVRRMIRNEMLKIFSTVDLILMPTAPTTAYALGTFSNNPVEMYLSDLFSIQANVSGIPAISIPFGKDKNGLPIGLQFMSADFREDDLLCGASLLAGIERFS
ncbi:MAG: Asp-tRNA(Asn)/Glu-tRNA(Gln) amidotransferase subunit GatA [Bacteroidetes bacterium]|nr:Asp-tRNA(Asn)/Glu-tRNA(Gln) amidotransferase subunit GatA [Bacteroidota bacterium]